MPYDFALAFLTVLYAWFCIETTFRLIDWWKQPRTDAPRVERRLRELNAQ